MRVPRNNPVVLVNKNNGKFAPTNGSTSRVHGVREATCFHKALDRSDLRGDGCGWGANLFCS